MSKTAEDVSASLSEQSPTLEPTDEIAALLIAEDESTTDDVKEDESLNQASNSDEDDDSNEEQEANDDDEEETTLELVEDGDPTWEGVLGVSEDSLSFDDNGNVAGFKTKVNGEEQIVSTADLIAGFQNNKANTAKSQAHADLVKAFEVQKGQVEKVYASKLQSVDALSKHFEKQLISEFDGVNWQELRASNPAEYAAMRHDYSAKASELQKIKEAIASDREGLVAETAKTNKGKLQAYAKGQFDTMIEKNPTWADDKVRSEARNSFKNFVGETYGFTEAEFETVLDHRLIEIVKDAKKYHEGSKVAEKKMLKPVPKFQKSRGKGVKPKVSKLEKLTRAANKAQGGEKRDLQASAVAELLIGGT